MSWQDHRLGDLVSLRSGGTPKKSESRYWDGKIPWLSSKDLTTPRIHDAPLHVTEEGVAHGTRLMPENTVMFVVRGMSLASEFRVSITKRPCAFNQDLKAAECNGQILPDFLFYSLFARREHIRALAGEASHGTKKLETYIVENIRLRVPDLRTQEHVIEIASTYDDLIENNRRRIALLEAAARLLYREWFVHFRFPGHAHVKIIAGIPEGWERTVPSRIIANHIGGGWGKQQPQGKEGEPALVIRGTDIPRVECGEISSVGLRFHSATSLLSRVLVPYDIVFEVSGGSSSQPIARTLLLTEERLALWNAHVICASFCKKFTFRTAEDALFFIFHIREHRDRGDVLVYQKESASSLKNFNFDAFMSSYEFSIPPISLRKLFFELMDPIVRHQSVLAAQIQQLSQARNLLLPRLMSGEIEV